MPNLRIIYDNAASRAITLSSSTTAVGLGVSNMLSDIKSKVCRSSTTTLAITLVWNSLEKISGVALPFCNLSPTATVQVQGYAAASDSVTSFDTGKVAACRGARATTGVNSFAYGGGNYASVWITTRPSVSKVVVTIEDPTNTAGYVEVSKLVLGDYWEPIDGADTSATFTLADNSKQYRTDAGDLHTDVGSRFRKQTFPLPSLNPTDRSKMWDILWNNGISRPIFLSMFPGSPDPALEQVSQLYGKLSASPVMATPYFNYASSSVDIQEV